jgi:hypothetical protein
MDSVLHSDWNLEQDRAMKFLELDAADESIVAFALNCTKETDSVVIKKKTVEFVIPIPSQDYNAKSPQLFKMLGF